MEEFDKLTPRKKAHDQNAYRKGFEEGGFAGAASAILIFAFIAFVLVPWLS